MRNVAAVLIAVALLIPAANAANVHINRPRIVYLTTHATELACKAPYRKGCTILDTEFFCKCVQNSTRWSAAPRFVVTPAIYTTTSDIMLHELQHIADVRASLNEYSATLTMRTFDDEPSCSMFVGEQQSLFSSTIKNIYRVTTDRRDGVRYAEHTGDH